MLVKPLPTETDTLNIAQAFAHALRVDDGLVVYLEGPLGAGKTTFARGVLRGLGYTEKVKSPTYTLVEPYTLEALTVYHFDFYRLQRPDELEQIGIEEYFSQRALCMIEWPEKGSPYVPHADIICHLLPAGAGREARIEALTSRGQAVLERMT